MSWKETNVMDERVKCIADYLSGDYSKSELSQLYGISRPTLYKWIERYEQKSASGLEDRSRAPKHHPNAVPAEMVDWLLQAREAHPSWGPLKLLPWLQRKHPEHRDWPVVSTVGEIIKRNGLVKPRKKRYRATPSVIPLTPPQEANRVWCADFKGDFQTQDGSRCVPLTISDGHTRYFLRCHGLTNTRSPRVQGLFAATFREYGMPEVMRTDNGPPFATVGLSGLSRLSVWWIKLGIVPERIEPGKPQQNGRHERLHRTLKAETAQPPSRTLRAQQKQFDRFREEYNYERPHEALGQIPPGDLYEMSPRPYPPRVSEPCYPETMQVRRVKRNGEMSWRCKKVYLCEALAGEPVGLEEVAEGKWEINFAGFVVGHWDERKQKVIRLDRIQRAPLR